MSTHTYTQTRTHMYICIYTRICVRYSGLLGWARQVCSGSLWRFRLRAVRLSLGNSDEPSAEARSVSARRTVRRRGVADSATLFRRARFGSGRARGAREPQGAVLRRQTQRSCVVCVASGVFAPRVGNALRCEPKRLESWQEKRAEV